MLLKLGYFADNDKIALLLRAVEGSAAGVVMVNGISRRVLDAQGKPAIGEGRELSGILGRAIHKFSLDNVKTALDIISADSLALKVVAVGVSTADDAAPYFDAGAAAVMIGSAPMFDPTLAVSFPAFRLYFES